MAQYETDVLSYFFDKEGQAALRHFCQAMSNAPPKGERPKVHGSVYRDKPGFR